MGRFVEGRDRGQTALFPECLDDYVNADNPVRVINAFVDELDLLALGARCDDDATARAYALGIDPGALLAELGLKLRRFRILQTRGTHESIKTRFARYGIAKA